MKLLRILVASGLVLLGGTSAFATFRAADLVVVPVAAYTPGQNNSAWRTDLEIRNVDTVPVDVELVFLPTGGQDNIAWYGDITKAVGWSITDGFTLVYDKLKAIPPGRAVEIDDVINTYWGSGGTKTYDLTGIKGALLVFACQTDTFSTTTPKGGIPKLIVVNSRTYSLGADASNRPTTYGELIPGIPWYDYIDPQKSAQGYNTVTFAGLREDPSYRTSVGLFNFSDRLTTLTVELTLRAADGTLLNAVPITLYPLEHIQYDDAPSTLFALTSDAHGVVVQGATLTVSVKQWFSSAAQPVPALMAYCTRVDNITNDPVYLEQTWSKELPWDCVFNGNCSGTSASAMSLPGPTPKQRPLVPPAR